MVASDTPYTSAGADVPLMVHVTAPATLPAGYTFEAEINGDSNKLFTCEVVRLIHQNRIVLLVRDTYSTTLAHGLFVSV